MIFTSRWMLGVSHLTPFENFKAKLEQKIQGFLEPWPSSYKLSFKTEPVSGYDYFIHKIDNEWADVFGRLEIPRRWTTHSTMSWWILLACLSHNIFRFGLGSKSIRLISLAEDSKIKRLSFDEYDKADVLSQSLLIKLIEMFDLISAQLPQQSGITRYLPDNPYYQEIDIFKKVLSIRLTTQRNFVFLHFTAP